MHPIIGRTRVETEALALLLSNSGDFIPIDFIYIHICAWQHFVHKKHRMLVWSYNQRYPKIKNGLIYGDDSILNLHLMIRVVLLKGGGTRGEALVSFYTLDYCSSH